MPQNEKKTNGESQVTAVDSETAGQKQSNIFKDFFIFFRLLFAAQPTWIDYFLIVFGTLCAAGAGVPFPLMGVLFGQLVDDFNGATCAADENTAQGGGDAFQFESAINAKVIKTAWIGAIAFALIYFYLTAWGIISQRLAQRLRNQYLAALLRQPPAFFDTRGAAGVVSSRLQGDITAVQAGTSEKVGTILTTFSFIITVFVIAFSQQPRLAGILISMLPVFLISAVLGGRYLSKYVGKQNEASSAASSIASEALEHISVVQAFSAAPRLESVFGRHMAQSRKHAMVKAAVAAVQTGMLYFVAYSANALAFWQGSIRIADSLTDENGNSTIGQIYAIVYLLIDACVMLGGMAPLLPFLSGAIAAYRRLLEDIETPSNIDATSGEGKSLPPGGSKNITFDNVSFEYPSRPGQQVLKNLNLDFPAGKYTAIVGLSGSGKSTIASLVARLHDPTSGSIKIGDDDLQSLNVKSLRSYMTFVQQEPTLFDCSVLENIAFGLVNSPHQQHQHLKPFLGGPELARLGAKGHDALTAAESEGADVAEVARLVRQAAEQADADGFIGRLTSGYGTSVGTRGTLLSGGQRQRVALAQALIREPEILILDEATASVDSASEQRVQQAVEKASLGKRTIISIAHRLSTIRNADNIIVLEAGEIIEQGTYSELMAKEDGKFAHMAKLQRVDSKTQPELESISSSSLDHTHAEKTDEIAVKEDTIRSSDERGEKTDGKEKEDDKKTPEEDTVQPFSGTIKGIAWLIRPSLGWFVIALIAAAFVGATFSGSGIIFGFTVGALNTCGNTASNIMSMGRFFAGLIFMLGGVELIANFLAWWGFGFIAERILYSLRILSFRSLLEQGLEWHQSEGRTPSGLLSIITKDCMSVGAFSGSTFGTVFAICINVVIAIIISNIFAWKIALVCLVMIPIQLGAGFMQLRMLARFEERHQQAFTKATSLAQEAIQSIRSVAVLSLEKTYMDTYHRLLEAPRRQVAQSAATTNILLAISHTIGTFINALAYWWGSQLIMKGEYTQRDLLIILVAMLTSAQLWGTMFTLAPEFSRARLAVSRVMKIIDLGSSLHAGKPSNPDVENGSPEKKSSSPPPSAKGGAKVSFKNVAFSYPTRPHAPILNDVTFDIAPNQFCGLVGPSGAGKSTIMSLVQRLYKPTGGAVMIDDRNIAEMSESFRDGIALVPQSPSLFDGTVKYNVGLGAVPGHEATDAEIEEACRLANIHEEIIALPDGYDTECGESASRFSGGQRQRLAIARALVRRPRLLLLDESTSALDANGEAALQEGLERASRGTTVLAITHRLHTVQKADIIFMVENGQIVDSGNHSELMERNEGYRLNAMQQMLQ
ncbi:hypothetical protein V2G26_021314 [Clonostachys chloroleuca]